MAHNIEYATLDSLFLDPKNPRLGRKFTGENLTQEQVLEQMQYWSLEELATSFLENEFWPQEALLCVKENLYGSEKLIVIEGNRRLAALKLLKQAFDGNPHSSFWHDLTHGVASPTNLFTRIPYIKMDNRSEIDAFLGYRHVTGIKEWAPAEKAEYISYLIKDKGLSYEEVRRKIGSKLDTVRRNYIAFRLLLQMEGTEGIDLEAVEDKFSVLFLAIRTAGVQQFLDLNIQAEPDKSEIPVKPQFEENLKDFSKWLFGTEEFEPLITDSRQVDRFAKALQSPEAVQYLRTARRPSLEYAFQTAGGAEEEVAKLIEEAFFNVEQSLSTIHLYITSERLRKAVLRLESAVKRVTELFKSQ